jgi:hypothetical protein
MKKVILFALALAVCGVFHNSVLAQENSDRYLVTYVRSSATSAAIRSATVITVINQSSSDCNVQVEWFVSPPPSLDRLCTNNFVLHPGSALQVCSRSLPGSIAVCGDVCSPQLTAQNHQGKAIVSSSEGFQCSLIAVDARVYFTTGGAGPSPANDTAILAISNSKVVFAGEGNLGD